MAYPDPDIGYRPWTQDRPPVEPCRIRHSDTAFHAGFFRFVESIFPGNGGQNWTDLRDRGGWTDQYEVVALVEGNKIVSTIGRSRMRLVIDGQDRIGHQLGAVATLAPYRRRGLARRLANWVADELDAPDQPIILFVNSTVLDFYPAWDAGGPRNDTRRPSPRSSRPVSPPGVRCGPGIRQGPSRGSGGDPRSDA